MINSKYILLIIPYYNMSRIMRVLPEMPEVFEGNIQMYPFLGVSYIAGSLRKAGFDVEIIDPTAESLSLLKILNIIKKKNPLFVGLYVNSFILHSTYVIIKSIRENFTTPIVVGGPHITSMKGFEKILGADYAITGYGEKSIVNLANMIYNHLPELNINQVQEELFLNENNNFDINSIPFPIRPDKFKKIYYSPFYKGPITTMIASRGCPFKCAFCASAKLGKYQRREAENVIEEIEDVIKDGYRVIQFQDDTFNIDRKWLHLFCEKLLEKGINKKIIWDCNIRPELIKEEDIAIMKMAGCKMIRFGVESYSDYLRNEIGVKRFSINHIDNAITIAKRNGIKVLGYFMFGLPSEREEDIKKTIDYIKSSKLDYIDVSITAILPSTEFEHIAIEQKIMNNEVWKEIAEYGREMPVFTEKISLERLRYFQKLVLYKFYFSYRYLIREGISSFTERRIMNSLRTVNILLRYYLLNKF